MKKTHKDEFQGQRPYQVDALSKVPSWLIILILKFWAAAAAVFFSVIGGTDVGLDFESTGEDAIAILASNITTIVLLGLFLALFMNYILRPFVRMMYNSTNNTYRYNMVNFKGIVSLPLALIYNMVLSVILYFITILLSKYGLVLDLFGTTEGTGIEPFTYAFCYIFVDFVFLTIKNVIVMLYKNYKYKKQMEA